MTSTLTDRYVDAAMRTVPEKQRPDLSAELRASIGDQIDARVDSGEPQEAAERAVLTELGDPDKLAAGYTDRPLHLIGPRYYLDWWRLLKLLMWIVPPFAAFGIALGQALSGAPFGTIIGSTIAGVIGVIVHLAFWTTLVFAVIERTAGKAGDAALAPWTLAQLPVPRESGAKLGDLIGRVVYLAVWAVAIVWDLLIGFVPGSRPVVPRPGALAVVDRGAVRAHGSRGAARLRRLPCRPLDLRSGRGQRGAHARDRSACALAAHAAPPAEPRLLPDARPRGRR